jgi:hypothetical protein
MAEPEYRFRLSLARKEETYRLTESALVRSAPAGAETSLPFSDVAQIRIYGSPGMQLLGSTLGPSFARCVVRPRRGRAIVLSSSSFQGFGKFDNRWTVFRPFVQALVQRVAAANPQAVFLAGMPPALWWTWIVLVAAAVVTTPLAALLIIVDLAEGRGIRLPAVVATIVLLSILLNLRSYIRGLRRNRPRTFDPRTTDPLDQI